MYTLTETNIACTSQLKNSNACEKTEYEPCFHLSLQLQVIAKIRCISENVTRYDSSHIQIFICNFKIEGYSEYVPFSNVYLSRVNHSPLWPLKIQSVKKQSFYWVVLRLNIRQRNHNLTFLWIIKQDCGKYGFPLAGRFL